MPRALVVRLISQFGDCAVFIYVCVCMCVWSCVSLGAVRPWGALFFTLQLLPHHIVVTHQSHDPKVDFALSLDAVWVAIARTWVCKHIKVTQHISLKRPNRAPLKTTLLKHPDLNTHTHNGINQLRHGIFVSVFLLFAQIKISSLGTGRHMWAV